MTTPYYDSGRRTDRRRVARGRPGAGDGRQRDHAAGGRCRAGGRAAAGSMCSISTRWSRRTSATRRRSIRSTCAAPTGCTSRSRAASSSGCGWPPSCGARPGPRRGVAGWRLAGRSATIDPVMVPEPALPVVRRADRRTTSTPWRRSWPRPSTTTRHRAHLPQPRRAATPGCAPTSARRCAPTTSRSAAATRPTATPARPSGLPPASRSSRGSRRSLTLLPVLPYVAANLATTLRLLNLVESMHPHEPHWYLATLGTAVEQQGKGVGSALMRPVLEHCDAEGMPVLPRVVQGAQRPLLPPSRVRGREGGAASRRGAAPLDHVEGAAAGDVVLSPTRRCACPLGRVDALGHGEGVVDDEPQHVDHGPHRAPRAGPGGAAPRRPGGGGGR